MGVYDTKSDSGTPVPEPTPASTGMTRGGGESAGLRHEKVHFGQALGDAPSGATLREPLALG